MLFNSLQFALFFLVVYGLYAVSPHQWQNRLLLIASYVFYAAWDWRFSFLLLLSTAMAYFCGLAIANSRTARLRKTYLVLSIAGNLVILGFFKYLDFFVLNLQALLEFLHLPVHLPTLKLIMPLGISFYTFRAMSYTIDIANDKMQPTRRFIDFALYVSFFPQLIAGPIERAVNLLPQILAPRQVTTDKFLQGCFLIFWGLFEKVFIADNLAKIVNVCYAGHQDFSGSEMLLASYLYTFQLFCDFDGYSNMAQGLGKLMGFELMRNFNLPFLVTDIQEFWNRWHISLSSWLRDYLYMPLFVVLKNRLGQGSVYLALLITMSLIGLWHGPAWTYTIFGFYHGVLLSVYLVMRTRLRIRRWYKPRGPMAKKVWFWARVVFMFHLITLGMIFFRSQSMPQVYDIFRKILFEFSASRDILPTVIQSVAILLPLFMVQYVQYRTQDLMILFKQHWFVQTAVYALMSYLIIGWGVLTAESFVYFMY